MPREGHTNDSNAGGRGFNRPTEEQPPQDGSVERLEPGLDQERSWLPTVPKMRMDSSHQSRDPMHLPSGQMYGDFFIQKELGRGAFGVVYLAEQLSLRRTVALKVTDITRDDGAHVEGPTMAQLEHPSIVRVYSQLTDEVNHRRLLCMQYVPGMTLRRLIRKARTKYGDEWQGKDLLEILENHVNEEEVNFSETTISDREVLLGADQHAALCWIGGEAAMALDHAHQAGYIHRDVKPENIIMTRFGRPMLVDFNLARESRFVGSGVVGGTIPYMPPESIRQLASSGKSGSGGGFNGDVYALGVMLWELATGEFPFEDPGVESIDESNALDRIIASRKTKPPDRHPVSPILAGTLRRAFQFEPASRYPSARDFAETLKGCARQHEVFKKQARHGWVGESVRRHPVAWLIGAALVPHIAASGLQIAYNQAEIINQLNERARELFQTLLFIVNPVAYGICVVVAVIFLLRAVQPWMRLRKGYSQKAREIDATRRNLLRLPRFVAIVGALGWLGGAIAFPGSIWLAQPFSYAIWLHFVGSFAISCAIAVTFSYSFALAVALYGIYPTCFSTPIDFIDQSRRQLSPFRFRWARLSAYAAFIPLITAVLLVAFFQPSHLVSNDSGGQPELAFKGLVIGLILASAFGFEFVRRIGQVINRMIETCIGAEHAEESLGQGDSSPA